LVSNMVKAPEILDAIALFLSDNGPTALLFGYATEQTTGDPNNKLVVISSQPMPWLGDVAYFIKDCPLGDAVGPGIDVTKSNDNKMTFGVIRIPLQSLETTIRCVYGPLLDENQPRVWGRADEEQQKEFSASMQ